MGISIDSTKFCQPTMTGTVKPTSPFSAAAPVSGIFSKVQTTNCKPRVSGKRVTTGMVGDFDKDGKADLTIIRDTANGLGWFTRRSSDRNTQVVLWGATTDSPVADFIFPAAQIDIDGDGIQDRMVVRDPNVTNPQTGDPITFYILRSSNNQPFVLQWGLDTDTMLFGDYDGDGKTDIVARRVGERAIDLVYLPKF
ncbi:MAG: VCBS repeat-containing protein [Pyrinomonadaceae bacterium]